MFTDDCAELILHIRNTETNERRRDMASRLILRGADSFSNYVNTVVALENATRIGKYAYGSDDLEDWQSTVSHADRRRNLAHDNVQTACASINRMCDTYGFGRHICPDVPDDPAERHEGRNRDLVANFAAGVTFETFANSSAGISTDDLSVSQRQQLTDTVEALKGSGMSSYDDDLVSQAVGRKLADAPSADDDLDGADETYQY